MSVPEGSRGEGRFSLEIRAEELAHYVITITGNEKVFVPDNRRRITEEIAMLAINAFVYIQQANDIDIRNENSPKYLRNKRRRRLLQESALEALKRMIPLIHLARRSFHLSTKRVKYWMQLVIEIRNRTRNWMESESLSED